MVPTASNSQGFQNKHLLKTRKNNYWIDALLLVFGALCQSFAYAIFIAPANIVPGGVYGLSIALNHLTIGVWDAFPQGLPIGTIALCFNVPLFLLAMKKLGLQSGGKTVATFLLIAIFTDLIMYFSEGRPLVENDPFLASVYGGAILGLGVFLTFRARSTSAGTDVIARVAALGNNIKVSTLIIAIDSFVVLLGLLTFADWKVPLYSWVAIFVYGKVLDIFQPENPNKAVFIISEKSLEMRSLLVDELGLQGTFLHGRGIYAGVERELIFMIVERKHLSRLKNRVLEFDPKAFIATANATNDTLPPLM